MKLLQLALLFVQLTLSLCASALGKKTLVLYDPALTTLEDFNGFFNVLDDKALTILSTEDQFELFHNGVLLYSDLILFTTKTKSIELAPANLLKFVENGGNIVVLSNSAFVNPSIRSFLNELGIYPSPKNNVLIDHFENLDEEHRLIKFTKDNLITDSIVSTEGDLQYKGSVALLSNNNLLLPILQAPSTSYSKNIVDDDLQETNWAVGSQGYVVVSHQSLNNGRVSWIGDQSFLQLNPEFSKDLIKWTFGERNILNINYVEHSHINGESYEERPYKIKDEISYNVSISSLENGQLKGYVTDDLQLDIKLLDPYHRLDLKVLEDLPHQTIYGITFKLPDHHGVFSFELNYEKPGYSYLHHKDIKSIRHLANDEFLRSWEITNSWVYITSSVVVFIGWFIFVWSFIYSSGTTTTVEETKKEK